MKAIIPCAGRNTRFNHRPKALACINGKTIIARIVESIEQFVDEIVIVVHSSQKSMFELAIKGYVNLELIIDDSYAGEASAINLVISRKKWIDDVLIAWGDIIYVSPTFLTEFVRYTADNPHYEMYIPATYEKYPYIALLLDSKRNPYDVFFSKEKGYHLEEGYHDMPTYIIRHGASLHMKDIAPSKGGEIKFLNLIKILYSLNKKVKIVEFKERKVISFNTPGELKQAIVMCKQLKI